jgi:phosphomannomutase
MNRFGAVAFGVLMQKGLPGGVASTAPSSDFALEIARQNNRPVFETAVGFKHFRAPLESGDVLVAFEESDGISFKGHTLEKCALAGFLAALEVMASTGKNLSAVYRELQKRYGYFYPGKGGTDVKGVRIEAWQEYKKAVVRVLQNSLYKKGDRIPIGETEKEIMSINTIDGLKIIFTDKSWILLRPSGTEPKFRYYYELAGSAPLPHVQQQLTAYRQAAEMILTKARALVDSN